MNNFYELTGLSYKIERDVVFKTINCYEDSPVYEDILETYEEIYDEMYSLVEPVAVLGFGTMPESIATAKYKAGTPVLYMVSSVGDGLKQQSSKGFTEGDYVKGMLCDAMADAALFSLEDQLQEKLKEVCEEHKMGVLARLEAPHDISMETQKEAWEHLELKKRFDIGISSGYMFDPVKTSCQLFILTEDTSLFKSEHDCRKCPKFNCPLRSIPDTEVIIHRQKVYAEDGTLRKDRDNAEKIYVKEKETLMDALIREGYHVNAFCGGKGRCGKCKVQILSGEVFITEEDKKIFTQKELDEGWRLSCLVYPTEELEILFEQNDEKQFEVLTEFADSLAGAKKSEADCPTDRVDIAIDIGTTTIAMALVSTQDGNVLHTVSTINNQRVYGADVISRIQASIDGKKEELQETIRKDLWEGMLRLLKEADISEERVERIVIGGNTTMGHLLMGYNCDTLGVYPFEPVNIDFIEKGSQDILGIDLGKEVIVLPGISTYVGGDIAAGMYACDFSESEEVCLLVDLGTNGEMALGNKEKIFVTSTAAGPAFEGGNITWGTGSIPGAICSVKLDGETAEIQTIGAQPPCGICGTGVVETTAELVREEIVEDSGVLDEDYFEDGFPLAMTADGKEIVFTQKDIREMQLAKAAVRAGIETLLLRYGVSKQEVAKVYIAGGFGYRLDISKAIAIGMLPEEFADRAVTVGNSCLAGAIRYLQEEHGKETLKSLVEHSEEIGLSADKAFNEFYMDAMFFEAE